VPLVGPGEDEGARAARREGRADLPLERPGLRGQAVPLRVEADLAQEQRLLPRQVLEPRQVRIEAVGRLEIDVEADEVQEGQIQVLGRRVVDVGDEPARVLRLGRAVQPLQETLHRPPAVPPHHRGRDLAADRVAQNRGVAGAGGHGGAHAVLDDDGQPRVIEEGDVLLPRNPDHDPQALPVSRLQQPRRRHGIGADRVETLGRDPLQVALDLLPVVELVAGVIRPEGAVGDPAHPERLAPDRRSTSR
jgi:hypothetical protein